MILVRAKNFTLSGYLSANGLAGAGSTNLHPEEDSAAPQTGAGGGSGQHKCQFPKGYGKSLHFSHWRKWRHWCAEWRRRSGGCIFFNSNDTQAGGVLNITANGGITGCKSNVNNGTLASNCRTGINWDLFRLAPSCLC